ncbi:unnamed protein product [Rotaria magnacalcarata]|uniref:Uncharacterized protein n=3 Tax=Rotaria magnacalcarata TaxID=392030 RepID=A0A814ZXJ4_9BILA|nr:unnamed protein product [Rotaria magnacalcarata]CAF2037990.1 unnamed protein product [Rotaria magnacalcarata]
MANPNSIDDMLLQEQCWLNNIRSQWQQGNFQLNVLDAFARLSHPKGSLDYKKMRNDIAANIRQGNLSYRTHRALLMNQNSNGENDAHNDEENNSDNDNDDEENNSDNDDDDEENESNNHVNDFQSRIRTIEVVDDSSNGEEE